MALAGLHGVKTFFQLAGRLVEGGGDLADFVDRGGGDAGGEIALGDAVGESDDALQAAGGVLSAYAASNMTTTNAMPEPSSRRAMDRREAASTSESG